MKKSLLSIGIVVLLFLFGSLCTQSEAFFFNKRLKDKIAALEMELQVKDREHAKQVADLTTTLTDAQKELDEAKKTKKSLQQQVDTVKKENADLKEQLDAANKKLKAYSQQEHEYVATKARIAEIEEKYNELLLMRHEMGEAPFNKGTVVQDETDVVEVGEGQTEERQ